MDEGRKRVIPIAASILAARKPAQTEARPHSPAYEAAIYDAIIAAERILQRIDDRWAEAAASRKIDGANAH